MLNLNSHIKKNWDQLRDRNLYVACSGGLDSMVLLHLLAEHFSVSVIHVNYQLRGEDSELDAQFVSDTCKSLNIPCEIRTVDLGKQLESGGNLQEVARDFRYQWFNEISTKDGNARVVLAHHANDQVETFFLNLARKSGVMGLSCMKSEHKQIIRPLLDFMKQNLIKYAESNGIKWREDVSNESSKYRRNRLRNELIPAIKEEIPSIETSVLTLIKAFQGLQKSLEVSVQTALSGIQATATLPFDDYTQLNSLERIELIRQLGLSATVALRIEKLYQSEKGKRIELSHDGYSAVVRDHTQFTFLRTDDELPTLVCEMLTHIPDQFSKDNIYLDAEKINGPLVIRKWELSDRIAPIGMTGSQLISDIIKDAHLTAQQKQEVVVLRDDTEIHACFGLKVGRSAIAKKNTEHIVKCSLKA